MVLKHSTKFKALWKYLATTLQNKIRRKWMKVESDTKVHRREWKKAESDAKVRTGGSVVSLLHSR